MKVTDKLTITNEDNMDMMARYPDKYFDLAIVDPEYGIDIANRTGSIGQKKNQGKITKYSKKNWDAVSAGGEYFKELFRVSKNQVVFGANYFTEHLPASKAWLIWDKKQPEGVSFAMAELIFTSFDHSAKIISCSRAEIGNKISNNTQLALANPNTKIHPTQKPVTIYKNILKRYAKQGDRILDTHLGSGSIAIACHDYGFELTACELDKEYYEKAIERIKRHTNQLQLFAS